MMLWKLEIGLHDKRVSNHKEVTILPLKKKITVKDLLQ